MSKIPDYAEGCAALVRIVSCWPSFDGRSLENFCNRPSTHFSDDFYFCEEHAKMLAVEGRRVLNCESEEYLAMATS